MNGLLSGALAKMQSFAQPKPLRSAVACEISTILRPSKATAVMLMPAFVEAAFTDAQTRCVVDRTAGRLSISLMAPAVIPACTRAE
jgi:hypothetical protein